MHSIKAIYLDRAHGIHSTIYILQNFTVIIVQKIRLKDRMQRNTLLQGRQFPLLHPLLSPESVSLDSRDDILLL